MGIKGVVLMGLVFFFLGWSLLIHTIDGVYFYNSRNSATNLITYFPYLYNKYLMLFVNLQFKITTLLTNYFSLYYWVDFYKDLLSLHLIFENTLYAYQKHMCGFF